MPSRPGKACRVVGCGQVVTDRSSQGYCEKHKHLAVGWNSNERRKGNRHQRGYGYQWEKLRAIVLKRDCYLCQSCKAKGKYVKGNHVDHIKPKAQGGSDSLSNLQTLCEPCHNTKTATERHRGAGQKFKAV